MYTENASIPNRWARPSRPAAIALCAGLVLLWGVLRLVVFETTVAPLTYALPLLICIWTRDRVMLWSMAAVFIVFHYIKLFYLMPPGFLPPAEDWANFGATFTNVAVGAVAVHIVIGLLGRLEAALGHVRAQAEELRSQGEELAQQNEELSRQTEELTQQGEELASQNEELQAQGEEIGGLNELLRRREGLLQALLETARVSGSEGEALRHIAVSADALFDPSGAVVVVYERTSDGLRPSAIAAGRTAVDVPAATEVTDGFVDLVLHEDRTASLNDATLRPDLKLASLPDLPDPKCVLSSPIHINGDLYGAFAVYGARAHDWTEEEFRLAEWLAHQCGRVLQTLRVQSALREADRRKSEFLATLSHELRNPLAAMSYALKLFEAGNGNGSQTAAIKVIQRQVQQLVRLVDDLLDATRLTRNKVQIRKSKVDLVPILRHAVEAARPEIEAARQTLDVDFPSEPAWVNADAERMAQVAANLLNNATRYTPSGGRIHVSLSRSAGEVVLSVTDTGVGIRLADLERVFEMFAQVSDPGSGGLGIGLALVRGIVELHGGRIEAHSEGPGRGSEFRVTLPLTAPVGVGSSRTDGEREGESLAGQPRRVLVVDDNADSARMMGALLEMHGHTVWIEHSGENALMAVHDFAPDVALLDIGLPKLDGYELARRLRGDKRTRAMRLIALTGWGQEADRARAREAGFDAHLTKPAEPELVLATIWDGAESEPNRSAPSLAAFEPSSPHSNQSSFDEFSRRTID